MRLGVRNCRRGMSLVELVTVMVAGAALMSVTIAALVAVQRADRRFNTRMSDRQTFGQLADQLRPDVHAAQRIRWDAAENRLTFTMPQGGSITYECKSTQWERSVSDGPNQPPHQSGVFRAPSEADFTMSPPAAAAGTLVRFTWTASAESTDLRRTTSWRREVVAAVGRDIDLLQK
jgi:Tfp pilus assembly protein PilV